MTPTQPQRRQNTSCDRCRRSKRRCFFQASGDKEAGVACANCNRLGHSCTFNFAESRLSSRRRRKQSPIRFLERVVEGFTDISSGEFQADSVATQDALASWLEFDVDYYGTCFPDNTDLSDSLVLLDSATSADTQSESPTSLQPNRSDRVQHAPPYSTRSFVGSLSSSPIHLLNSKLDGIILDERLAKICDAIVIGSASRFVDYDCNLYATACHYQLEDVDSKPTPVQSSPVPNNIFAEFPTQSSQTNLSPLAHHHSFGQLETEESRIPRLATEGIGHSMTMLGTIRFLDHFADLYGNPLTRSARGQSDAVLKAVLRAFSLQWLTTSEAKSATSDNMFADSRIECDPLTNAFHDAWFQARSLIKNALSVRSFRVVYAILLFDGITIPKKATQAPHEFLDEGLKKLSFLCELVEQYYANFKPHSTYRTLLEVSLSVTRWGGYIRDIGAALTTDHRCKLPVASKQTKAPPTCEPILAWPNYQSLHQDLDGSVPNVCQKGVAEAFFVWRQIIEVKDLIFKPTHSGIGFSKISETITSTLTAVGKFNQLFRPFLSLCIENLNHLSIRSRTSAVSIEVFWDLGVLILAETLRDAMKGRSDLCEFNLLSTMRTYQEEAVASIARTVECVLSLPTEEIFNLQNGLNAEVPIIAYHITPSLMVTAFQKAIENIIELQFSPPLCDSPGKTPHLPVNSTAWQRQIDIIMKGLSSLRVTVGGSQAVSAAFQSLMWQHGDILSECWSSDFST